MKRFLCPALIVLFCSANAALAAPVVILSGEIDGQGPGSLIEETTVVSIPAGQLVVFNDATGQTKTLTGPFDGPINADPTENTSPTSGLDRLIASRSAEQSRLGAIRAAPGQVPVEAELISVAQTSVQCVARDAEASLWRPETLDSDSFFTLTDIETGQGVRSIWHAGVSRFDWPSTMPLRSGARYSIELEIAPRPVEITLYIAPSDFASDADLAAWMGLVGCRRQAFALLDRIAN